MKRATLIATFLLTLSGAAVSQQPTTTQRQSPPAGASTLAQPPATPTTAQGTPVSTATPQATAAAPGLYLGVATCANSGCHGSTQPLDASRVLQNEYYTWLNRDRHAQAYNVLFNDRSARIARNMGPIPGLTFSRAGILLLITILGGASFSAIGLYLGTGIPPQQIGLMFTVILGPMIMFGCTYYPWRGLDAVPAMKYAVLIDPLVYVSEGLRSALTPGLPHMSLWAISAALLGLTTFFTLLGLRTFMKRAVS